MEGGFFVTPQARLRKRRYEYLPQRRLHEPRNGTAELS